MTKPRQWRVHETRPDGHKTWLCTRCLRGLLPARAPYPSPYAVCLYCGRREAGDAVADTGPAAEVHVEVWRDGDGARVYCDGQGMSLGRREWHAACGKLAELLGRPEEEL